MGETEQLLIGDAAAGDRAAFEALLRPFLEPAYRLACGILLDRTEAEDAVQEAAVSAWRKIHTLRAGSDFRPWFMAIVVNRCRSVRRSRWWSVLRSDGPEPPPAFGDPSAKLDVQLALRRLRPKDRALLVLRFYSDSSLEEIADVLGISVSATKSRLHRALARLRPYLGVVSEWS